MLLMMRLKGLVRHPAISLSEERRLIAKAKKGNKAETEELILRHISFIVFRIYKKAFPRYIDRFGDDMLDQAVLILYEKVKTYNLRYRNKRGEFTPVRFSSYIWKRIDGFILDFLKKELQRERCHVEPNWDRFDQEEWAETML
jgi:DNA-directed RNA polymerase specialized sigma subunit